MATYTVIYNEFKALGKFPGQALSPIASGFTEVTFEPGDYSAVVFNPLQPARYFGTRAVVLSGGSIINVNGILFDGLWFNGGTQVRGSVATYKNCYFTAMATQPLRVRYGSTCTVELCEFRRTGTIPTNDIVAIYTSDGINVVNVRNSEFWNYTDGIQFGFRANTDYGLNAGSVIENNVFGISKAYLYSEGEMHAGLENALDFKSGGTVAKPIIVTGNKFIGYRPALLPNAGTPGYAITFHKCATDFVFKNNAFVDCEAGYFLNAQYKPDGTWQPLRLTVDGDCFYNIKNHGLVTTWPTKQGSVVCGTNSGSFSNLKGINCDRLEEGPVNAAAGPRTFINCKLI